MSILHRFPPLTGGGSSGLAAATPAEVAAGTADDVAVTPAALHDAATLAALQTSMGAASLGGRIDAGRLDYLGTSALQFTPVWGAPQLLPDGSGGLVEVSFAAPISIDQTGNGISEIRHVYGYAADGALAVEKSSTAPVAGAGGLMVQTGAPSRLWLGSYRTDPSGNYADIPRKRLVRSAYNQPAVAGYDRPDPVPLSYTGTVLAEWTNGATVEFLSLPGDTATMRAAVSGYLTAGTSQTLYAQAYLDGTAVGRQGAAAIDGPVVGTPIGRHDQTFSTVTYAYVRAGFTLSGAGTASVYAPDVRVQLQGRS